MGLKLNLGCGRWPIAGCVNVDVVALPGVDVVADLERCATQPLPFDDDSVDEFFMSHVIEHISNALPLMQELWRLAQPGATMTIRCPHGASDDACEDPTHVRPMYPGSFGYFSQPYYWRADYGYRGDWQPFRITMVVDAELANDANPWGRIRRERNLVSELIAELVAIKPAREPLRELQVTPSFHLQVS